MGLAVSTLEVAELRDRLDHLKSRIASACARVQRDPHEIRLIGVSKTHSRDRVVAAWEAGLRDFGENRVQEASEKFPLPLRETGEKRGCSLHLIGPLQRNKVRKALPFCAALHGVDSLALYESILRVAHELNLNPDIYLQVNTSREPQKSGFLPEALLGILAELPLSNRVRLVGLMTMGPAEGNMEVTRQCFQELRGLLKEGQLQFGTRFPDLKRLSMGMSGDFEMAIEEGAHDIRVGSALFGHRERL